MSIFSSRPKPAPPPIGRSVSWPTHRRIEAGAPRWQARRTVRVDMLITGVDGNVEHVVNTVVLNDE